MKERSVFEYSRPGWEEEANGARNLPQRRYGSPEKENEQEEDWAQDWSFQLRVCDALGGAVPVTVLGGRDVRSGGSPGGRVDKAADTFAPVAVKPYQRDQQSEA